VSRGKIFRPGKGSSTYIHSEDLMAILEVRDIKNILKKGVMGLDFEMYG